MSPRSFTRLAWSLWALALVLWVGALVLWSRGSLPAQLAVDPAVVPIATLLTAGTAATFIGVATLGLLVGSRQPRNPLGWLSLAAALLVGLEAWTNRYVAYSLSDAGSASATWLTIACAWLASWLANASTITMAPVLLLLPNGRLPSRRWRFVLWLATISAVVAVVAAATLPGPLRSSPSISNPGGIAGSADVLTTLETLAQVGIRVGLLLSALSVIIRLRSARGEERLQLKWVMYGAIVWALAFAVTFVIPPSWSAIGAAVYLVALNLFVASLGFAILKYGLYQIDRVIFRTLVYGLLAAFIAFVYVAIAVGVGALVGRLGEPNLGVSLAATALVAIAFQPARERAERLANRLVYGRRSSPYDTLAKFSRQVGGVLSVDEVLPRVAEVAAVGVGASRSRVRVYVPGGRDRAVAWPTDALDAPFDLNILVLHQGQPVGELAIAKPADESLTDSERALLTDLAAQAGPALSNVRLALELRSQADELRASRQRIVSAQDSERRRIERDIHDGAQQGLVALAITARLARELIQSDPAEADTLLGEVQTQANESLEALRNLARGIFPPVLSDRGLVAALDAHITRSFPRARLELDGAPTVRRVGSEQEAGVYFCCLEALQNCAKHAPASAVTLRLSETEPGWLTFEVSDSGPGFDVAATSQGSGLQHMTDRVAALGGTLEVRSGEGNGTTIQGRVPVLLDSTL